MSLPLPTFRIVEGRPSHPGRARLLQYRRPQRPEAHRTRDVVLVAGLAALCSGLLVHGWTWESVRGARAELAVVEQTNELLSAHADWLACEYVYAAQRVRGIGDFAGMVEVAEEMGAGLEPEVRAWCRGER